MHPTFRPRRFIAVAVATLLGVGLLPAQEPQEEETPTLVITNAAGTAARFSPSEGGWRWTRLTTPRSPEGGWGLKEAGSEIATAYKAETLSPDWTLVELQPDRAVFEQDAAETGLRVRRVFSFGPASNVLRVETWVQSPDAKRLLTRISLLDVQVEGESFRETGTAPASFPAFGQSLFAGIEHISGECTVFGAAADHFRLLQRPRVAVEGGWQFVAAVIVGWTQPDVGTGLTGDAGLREAFLHYLDSVRIKPERIVLHTDTWWSIAPPLNEAKVIADIDALHAAFAARTGMFFDTYCVDLGWSNPKTLWQMDTGRFPNELRVVDDHLAARGTQMGLWLSPGSGYSDGLSNSWLQSQGYEMTPFGAGLEQVPCFALGTRYQRETKDRLVGYARQYGLGHVILDFMAQRCDVPTHGHPIGVESRYAIDAGLADVLDSLRAVNPSIVLEPMVCGYPPSPWWLMKTPFVLGPAGDDMPYGRGPSPDWLESLITARDVAYRAGQEAWLMPTQALETFDIIMLTPGTLANTAVMAVGRGRWFLSTYFKTNVTRPEDWDFLAGLVRWARQNKEQLGNAWQFGGRPENREPYGFMFRNAGKDLYCVRNPSIEEQTIVLPAASMATAAVDVHMIYPRRAAVGRIEAGGAGPRLKLAPYETVFLETRPAAEVPPEVVPVIPPVVTVHATPPLLDIDPTADIEREKPALRYSWSGVLDVPEITEGELCILVEGDPEIDRASLQISLGSQVAKPRMTTSVGQFGAAQDQSPDNWTWFIVPLTKGVTPFQIELTARQLEMAVGVYVRGVTPVQNDPEPETGAVFPTQRPNLRAWSQTLQPLKKIPSDE